MTKQKEKKKASIVKKMMIAVVAGFVWLYMSAD